MNTYRKTLQVISILLLVVFVFTASAHVRSGNSRKAVPTTYQSHLENLVLNVIPNWQTAFFTTKSPLLGTTWNALLSDFFSNSVRISDALSININAFSHYFVTPANKAP